MPNAQAVISTKEILEALKQTSMDARKLVRTLLTASPHTEKGRKLVWPELTKLSVKDVLGARMNVPGSNRDKVVPGIYAASLILGKAAAMPLLYTGRLAETGYPHTEEQVQCFYAATRALLALDMDTPVLDMLTYAAVRQGFFRGYNTYDLDELENSIDQCIGMEADAKGVQRIVDEVLSDGHRLTVWRTGYAPMCRKGEKLYDISALQTDLEGNPRMHVDLRVVCLPRGISEGDAFWLLDTYDDEGLELGYGLKGLVHQGFLSRAELFDEGAIVHLQSIEVRSNLRGQGLGVEFARQVLARSLKGLKRPPAQLVTSAAPMQYDFPLEQELPSDFLLEALDSTERLREHLLTADLTSVVPSLKGRPLLFISTDVRLSGTYLEKMDLLSENTE